MVFKIGSLETLGVSNKPQYLYNITTIKKLGSIYKLTTLKIPMRNPGYELNYKIVKKNTVNSTKLLNNLIRAKTTIKEYALCNDFDYFITLTLDKEKYDRYNLKNYIKDLGQFIRDYRKKYKSDIQYLFIPEQHQDGAWHIHGLIRGIEKSHLINFDNIPSAPLKLKNKNYFNFTLYHDKFGFNSLGEIKSKEKIANYICKYIQKDLGKNLGLGAKTYYASRGLNKGETIKKGLLESPSEIIYDFLNEYCSIKQLNNLDNIIIRDL